MASNKQALPHCIGRCCRSLSSDGQGRERLLHMHELCSCDFRPCCSAVV